jgi:hypothetical protein
MNVTFNLTDKRVSKYCRNCKNYTNWKNYFGEFGDYEYCKIAEDLIDIDYVEFCSEKEIVTND